MEACICSGSTAPQLRNLSNASAVFSGHACSDSKRGCPQVSTARWKGRSCQRLLDHNISWLITIYHTWSSPLFAPPGFSTGMEMQIWLRCSKPPSPLQICRKYLCSLLTWRSAFKRPGYPDKLIHCIPQFYFHPSSNPLAPPGSQQQDWESCAASKLQGFMCNDVQWCAMMCNDVQWCAMMCIGVNPQSLWTTY